MNMGPMIMVRNMITRRQRAPTASFRSRKLRRTCLPGLTSSSLSIPAALFSISSASWLLPPRNQRESQRPRTFPFFFEELFGVFLLILSYSPFYLFTRTLGSTRP